MWGFEILNIEPTKDTRQIKKAYAKLAAQYHPEEYPEKWQEIHNAFELAMKYAKMGGSYQKAAPIRIQPTEKSPESSEKQSQEPPDSPQPPQAPPPQKQPPDFSSVLAEGQMLIHKQWETDKEKLQKQLQALRAVSVKESDDAWRTFLSSGLFLKYRFRAELIQMLEQTLRENDISLEAYTRIQILVRHLRNESNQTVGLSIYEADTRSYLENLQQLENAARLSSLKSWQKTKDKKDWIVGIKFVFAILLIGYLFIHIDACQQKNTQTNSLPTTSEFIQELETLPPRPDFIDPELFDKMMESDNPLDLLLEEVSQNENHRN